MTGSGNDTFTLNNLETGTADTVLGLLDAGGGVNTLNFNSSTNVLDSATRIQNFANLNLNATDLTLVDRNNISSNNISLDDNSRLAFGSTFSGTFGSNLLGSGLVEVLSGSNVTLQNISSFGGRWQVEQSGVLSASSSNQLGTASLALNGTLNLSSTTSLNNALTGTGLLNVNNANNAFSFGASSGSAFAGTAHLQNTQFALSGLNTTALTHATLELGSGSFTTVGLGTQNVGDLKLLGGSLTFNGASSPRASHRQYCHK